MAEPPLADDHTDQFPLGGLSSRVLERIVTKVKCKSYCRLQQTCKKMKELAQTQNIRVRLDLEFKIISMCQWTKNDSGCDQLEMEIRLPWLSPGDIFVLDFESLYGIRFNFFPLPEKFDDEQFERFRNLLTKYRLSAGELIFTPTSYKKRRWSDEPEVLLSPTSFSNDQCEKLLEILKPYRIRLDISNGNRGPVEACVRAKHLKSIDIIVHPNDALEIIRTLITSVPCVDMKTTADWSVEHYINCFQGLLEIFRYEIPQHFKRLHFFAEAGYRNRGDFIKEIKHTLHDINLYPDGGYSTFDFYLKTNMEYTRCNVEEKYERRNETSGVELYFQRCSIFPLFDLPPNLLERIVNKLEYSSFFRLQRTCKDIGEFVKVNKNINVCLEKEWQQIFWKDDENDECKLCGQLPDFIEEGYHFSGGVLELNFDSLYGVHFGYLPIPKNMSEAKFNEFCDLLKKYHITSTGLYFGYDGVPYTTAQYVKLLNILKPSAVSLDRDSNFFEACFQAFHTTHRKVTFNTEDLDVLERLLSGPISTVHVEADYDLSISEFHELLVPYLQLLRSEPSISSITYYAPFIEDTRDYYFEEDIMDLLGGYEPVLIHTDEQYVFDFAPFPDGSVCQLLMNTTRAEIRWNRGV